MYNNLLAEIARKNLKVKTIGEAVDLKYQTIRNRLIGKTDFSRREMVTIRDVFFPEHTLEYLFHWEDSTK